MWNVAVCDDEPEICAQLQQALERFCEETGETIHVMVFESGECLLQSYPQGADVLLLDIRMNGLSGMDVARTLRQRGCAVTIIFITTMAQYAIDGYAVHAFGFLRKPLQYQQLHWVLSDALAHLRNAKGEQIIVNSSGGVTVLNSRQVLFFEAFHHEVTAHCVQGAAVPCMRSLAELEQALNRHNYFRCHKSYLVNFEHVLHIGPASLTMKDGQKIGLSKYRRKEFLLAFARYCGGGIP